MMTTQELHDELRAFEMKMVKLIDNEVKALEEQMKIELGCHEDRLGTVDSKFEQTMEAVRATTRNVDALLNSVSGDPKFGIVGLVAEVGGIKQKLSELALLLQPVPTLVSDVAELKKDRDAWKTLRDKATGGFNVLHALYGAGGLGLIYAIFQYLATHHP